MKAISLILGVILAAASLWAQGPAITMSAEPAPPNVEKLALDLQSILLKLDQGLSEQIHALSGKAASEEAIRELLKAVAKNSPEALNAAFIDPKGILLYLEPEKFQDSEGADVSGQAHIIAMREKPRPILSSPFKAAEGFMALSLAHPLFNDKGEFRGEISLALDPQALVATVLKNNKVPPEYELWGIEEDGNTVVDPDLEEIGKNIFTDPLYDEHESLRELGKQMVSEPTGKGEYHFFATGTTDVIRKLTTWATISMHGKKWIMILVRRA